MAVIIKHGKFWKQFTCPKCGCVFHDSSVLFPYELASIRNLGAKTHNEIYCPECHTRCLNEED